MLSKALALLAASLAATSSTVVARPQNTLHQRYPVDPAASVLVPFVNGSSAHLNFTNDPSIRYNFSWEGGQSAVRTVFVDTGSVGAVIGAYYFPGWTKYHSQIVRNTPGHILYTSSGNLLTGRFVDVDFEFNDATLPLKAHGPILVVDRTVVCKNYTVLIDGHYCPEQYIDGPDVCNGTTCKNSYFGIGWARGTNPASNNPLLNVVSVDNTPVSADYTFGYTLTYEGLHVGLTEQTTAGFTKVQLERNSDAKFDWAQVQGCLEFDSTTTSQATPGACVSGKFLLDTGIDQGYATVTADNGLTGWRYYTDSNGVRQAHSQNLTEGYTVTSKFGSSTNPDQYEFAFTLGQSPLSPPWLLTSLNATTPTSLNTGRHFFRINDMMYDATNGVWGARLRYGTQVPASIPTSASNTTLPSSVGAAPGSPSSQALTMTNSRGNTGSTAVVSSAVLAIAATRSSGISPIGTGLVVPTITAGGSGAVAGGSVGINQGGAGQAIGNSQNIGVGPGLTGAAATGAGNTESAGSQSGSGNQSGTSGQDGAANGASDGAQVHNC